MSRLLLPLGFVCLLVGELEYMLVTNFTLRTELREALHLPLYHLVLALLALLGLRLLVSPGRLKEIDVRLSPSWLLVHATTYLFLLANLGWLAAVTDSYPRFLRITSWLALGAALLTTWFIGFFRVKVSAIREILAENWWLLPVALVAPYLAELTASWWTGFSGATFFATEFLLQLVYSDVISEPVHSLLGTSRFYICIRPGCSGYEGMGLMAFFSAAYTVLKSQQPGTGVRISSLIWFAPFAMALAWSANILRLAILVLIGSELSPSIATRGFHSQAGWICFTLLSFGLICLLEHRALPLQTRLGRPSREWAYEFPGLSYMAPLMVVLIVGLASSAFSDGFEYLYGLRVIVFAVVGWFFCRNIRLCKPALSSVLVGFAVYLLWVAMTRIDNVAPSPFAVLGPKWSVLWIGFRLLGSVVVAPITEELFFRGFLLRRLYSRDFESVDYRTPSLIAHGITSLIFGLSHEHWLPGVFAGLAYGWVARLRGGLSNCIVAHMVTNLCLSLQVVILGDWWLW